VSVVRQSDSMIELRAPSGPVKNGEEPAAVLAELGVWETETGNSTGVVIDLLGDNLPPLLSANDVRKLGKWLLRAAEALDGKPASDKKHRPRRHYDEEDE
jgi:hypothetical protein